MENNQLQFHFKMDI